MSETLALWKSRIETRWRGETTKSLKDIMVRGRLEECCKQIVKKRL